MASPGRWLMWCTAKTLRCSIPSRLTLERPKRLSCDLVIDAIDSATLSPPTIKNLRSTDHVCKFKERYHPHPTPTPPHPMTCVAPTTCASSKNVIIPTPPHPNPMTCVAPTMCASARNMMLRSTDHVCKFKERYHPHPTPSHDLRSTDHVCKFKERYHPHPTPPQSHDLRSTDHVCKRKEHDVA